MKLPKFNVSYEHGVSRLIEASTKVFLTCPECHHRYELRHSHCGMPLHVKDALERHTCEVCMSNGQDPYAILPLEVADCPKCGHKCRTIEDIEEPKITKVYHTRRNRLPPANKRHLPRQCEACGFTSGLEVHHKDWNHRNNNPENLQVLCKWCHVQASKLGAPEFERMLEIVRLDQSLKTSLRKSAEDFYNRLPKHI